MPFNEQTISTAFGTALESGVETATFGLVKPDIVPDWQEQQNQWAATVGHIGGSIAGIIPSFGLSMGAAKIALKGFSWGRAIIAGAEYIPTPFNAAITGIAGVTAPFAIDNMAREFVRQVKEQEPDLYRIGKAAVGGAVVGVALGPVSKAFYNSPRITQAVTSGTSLAIASAINDAAMGEDVFSTEYATKRLPIAFLQGMGIGLWNSRGYKERIIKGEAEQQAVFNKIKDTYQMIDAEGNVSFKPVAEVIEKETGVKMTEIGKQYPKFHAMLNAMEPTGKYKGGTQEFGLGATARQAQGRIHASEKLLGWDKETRVKYMQEWTGKESTKDFTKEDYQNFAKGLNEYLNVQTMAIGREFKPLDMLAPITGVDKIISKIGADDLVEGLQLRKEYMDLERRVITTELLRMGKAIELSYKNSNLTPQRTGNQPVFRKSSASMDDFAARIEGKIGGKTGTEGLTPELTNLFKEYKFLTDFMWQRRTQTEIALGEQVTPYNEYYMKHTSDKAAYLRAGKREEWNKFHQAADLPESATRMKTMGLVSSQFTRAEGSQMVYKNNPIEAAIRMVNEDLKVIYLKEPQKIFNKNLELMKADGTLNESAYTFLKKWQTYVIKEQPTPGTMTANRAVERLMNTKPGKFIEDELAKLFDMSLSHNPVKDMNNLFTNAMTQAYMGFRPKLAIRNATQFLLMNGLGTDSVSIARGMAGQRDKVIDKIMTESLYRKQAIGTPETMFSSTESGKMSQAAMDMFTTSNQSAIDTSMLSHYWHVRGKIMKNKGGWADEAGIQARKQNKEALSEGELFRLTKEVNYAAKAANFLYTAGGLPLMFRSDVLRPITKLWSYPMLYVSEFLTESAHRFYYGKPGWAKASDNIKLSVSERAGILKHFIGLGLIIAAAEEMGFDYSSIVGVSYSPTEGKIQAGAVSTRPSPGLNMLLSIRDVLGGDEYKKAAGWSNLYNLTPIPGRMAYKDVMKNIEEGDRTEMFLYKKHQRPPKKIRLSGFELKAGKSPFSQPFGKSPFGTGAF